MILARLGAIGAGCLLAGGAGATSSLGGAPAARAKRPVDLVVKVHVPRVVRTGKPFPITVGVKNKGPGAASDALLTLWMPDGGSGHIRAISATRGESSTALKGTYGLWGARLRRGHGALVWVTAVETDSGSTWRAEVKAWGSRDLNPGNNAVEFTVLGR